ncbi:beta-lactamase family protein [Candidatus Kaiserbacteria bacterium]|nr:beta-lactamase family protein [Candidatus Kaiserbacteria bacterium]
MKPREERIVERCIRAVEERVCPGGIVGTVRASGEKKTYPFGHLTDIDSAFVMDDTMYDVASITKSIPTASLTLALIDKGALSLDDLVAKHLHEFRNNYSDRVTIWHLLTYTIDSAPLSTLADKTSDEILAFVMARDMEHEPGTAFRYSNTPALLLGLIIERVLGVGIAQAAQDVFFRPLGMKSTGFMPQKNLQSRIAPSEGGLRGVVHDESARVFASEGRAVGHAGLFSTAPDMMNFLEMLLRGGEMRGRRYLSQKIIRDMATNQISELGDSTGLGWELNQARFMGKHPSERTFGKTGFAGTSIVCDIERGSAFVILTNRTYPKRPPDDTAINAFRNDIADILLA